MGRPVWAVLVSVGVALAGCAEAPDGGVDGDEGGEMDGAEQGIPMPTWHAGLWWTWEYTFHYTTSLPATVDLVVTEATPSGYLVEPSDDIWAFEEALEDVAPVGMHRGSDLAMPQPNGFAQVFQWPLTDGAEWTFDWYGATFSAVGAVEGEQRYQVVATNEDGSVWTYWYNDAFRWMESFEVVDADGNPILEMEVTPGQGNYTGEVVRATVTELVSVSGTGPHQETEADWDFSDKLDADVYASLLLSCVQGSAFIGVGTVESLVEPTSSATGVDDGASYLDQCPVDKSFHGLIGDDPHEGTWGYSVDVASDDAVWGLSAWLAEYERVSVGA